MADSSTFSLIKPGEGVQASTANRPLQQIIQELLLLKQRLAAAAPGSALYAYDVAVSSTAAVGQAVYANAATGKFDPAIAATAAAGEQSALSNTAAVWGIVSKKSSANVGDLLLAGYGTVSLAAAVTGTVLPGLYYLSSTLPGRLTLTRPSIAVPVLRVNAAGNVFVLPQWNDLAQQHIHYKFPLQPQPSGASVTLAGTGQATIVGADPSLEGWLPASHAVFSGRAPLGAKFGYNISANSRLAGLWPPAPLDSAYLEWNRGDAYDLGQSVPIGANQLCQFDLNGIWWMADCTDQHPWDEGRLNASGHTLDDYYVGEVSQSGSCFTNYHSLTLWFSRPAFNTNLLHVTSLKAVAGSRLEVTCERDGSGASTGPLLIDLDIDFNGISVIEPGHIVVKEFDGTNFKRGPVTEGVYTTGTALTLNGSSQSTVLIGGSSRTLHAGRVAVESNPATNLREIDVILVKLEGASEEYPAGIPSVSLPYGRASSYVGKFNVPAAGLPAGTKLRLQLQIAGSVAGALPALTYKRRLIHRGPTAAAVLAATATPVALPTADTTQTLALAGTPLSGALQYVTVESNDVAVTAGDVVLFSISRSASDAYGGDLYIIQQSGTLYL